MSDSLEQRKLYGDKSAYRFSLRTVISNSRTDGNYTAVDVGDLEQGVTLTWVDEDRIFIAVSVYQDNGELLSREIPFKALQAAMTILGGVS